MRNIHNTGPWNIIETILVFLVIESPILLFCYQAADISYLITCSIFALPVAFLVASIGNKPLFIIALSILLICSLTELVMVKGFQSFIISGNLLALISTTPQESTSFAKNNLVMLLYFIPVLVVFCAAIAFFSKQRINRNFQYLGLLASILLASGYVTYKQVFFYHGVLTNRYYIEKYVLTRPPYNMFLQIRNAVKTESMRKYIKESEGFSFKATREINFSCNEIYVLGIGESMAYNHTSLNDQYFRETMPKLKALDNIVSYSNYYSGACLTMYSVPQIVTRATPESYELNFKEKSIIQPFKEIGFKTYGIVCGNLLGYETYLTAGVDSLFLVDRDIDIPHVIDSLSSLYPKTFFVTEFLGCHSFYYNYEEEYDIFHPNINSDPEVKSDSLYINAYDNTILYADYVMSEIVKAINKPGVSSTFTFVSDHGENVGPTGGGHGGDCSPQKNEYHVPLIIWHSQTYSESFPEKITNLIEHKDMPVCCDNLFYSICDMAAIKISEKYWKSNYSIFADNWSEHERFVLLPDGINTFQCE